jgi:hypothetical protein
MVYVEGMNLKVLGDSKKATIALIVLLVGYGIYQAVYATNESAYQFGYKQGKDAWDCYKDPEAGCFLGNDACTSTITNAAKVVTNQTACIHGFINGWNKVCTHSIDATDGSSKAICPDNQVNEGLPLGY